jgi:hypothetical protein
MIYNKLIVSLQGIIPRRSLPYCKKQQPVKTLLQMLHRKKIKLL